MYLLFTWQWWEMLMGSKWEIEREEGSGVMVRAHIWPQHQGPRPCLQTGWGLFGAAALLQRWKSLCPWSEVQAPQGVLWAPPLPSSHRAPPPPNWKHQIADPCTHIAFLLLYWGQASLSAWDSILLLFLSRGCLPLSFIHPSIHLSIHLSFCLKNT